MLLGHPVFKIKYYRNFQIDSWKVIIQIEDNLFLYLLFLCININSLFWIFYFYLFHNCPDNHLVYYLLNYIYPTKLYDHAKYFTSSIYGLFVVAVNDENTKEFHHWKNYALGLKYMMLLFIVCQATSIPFV